MPPRLTHGALLPTGAIPLSDNHPLELKVPRYFRGV